MTSNKAVDLTVIIPAYNAAEVLGDQLEALSGQHVGVSWEVVVVDNGSTDHTKGVALTFADRLPLRVVAAEGRRSSAAACNVGVAGSNGQILIFLDADDVVAEGYIDAMLDALEAHDFVASRLDCESLNPQWAWNMRSPAQRVGLGEGLFPYAYGGTLGVRRSPFQQIGGFDESFHTAQDIDFCYRMGSAGFQLAFVPEALLRYRFRTSPAAVWRQAYAYGVGSAQIYRSYRDVGESAHTLSRSIRIGGGLLRHVVASKNRSSVGRLLYFAANRLGYLRGYIGALWGP